MLENNFELINQLYLVILFYTISLRWYFYFSARWQSGYAADCKSVYGGSIPFRASFFWRDKISRFPCIVGVSDARINQRGCVDELSSVLSIQKTCAIEALNQSGLEFKDIDGLAVAGLWGMPGPGVMQPNVLTEYLGINYPSWLDGTNTGGSAFIFHLNHASQAIKNKLCNNVLILYGSTQKSNKERSFLNRPAILSSQFDMIAGLPSPVGAYALAAQRHMYKYGSNSNTLAEIAVSARKWATLNKNAYKREKLTVEEVLNSSKICSPLSKLDCCLVTDGGGAIVLSNSDFKETFKSDPIYIKGFGESSSHSSINYMEDMPGWIFITIQS